MGGGGGGGMLLIAASVGECAIDPVCNGVEVGQTMRV